MHAPLLVGAMGPDDELRPRAKTYVRLEDMVGVVEVGNDQVELGEVVHQVFGQFAVAGEETGKRAGLNGLNPVDQTACHRQLGDVRIAEDFEMCSRELLAQGRNRRKRKDEVPDGAATDNEDLALQLIQSAEA